MESNDKKFEEQDHPLKNTDHAFVQVGKNGEPVIPKDDGTNKQQQPEQDRTTTLDHR
jgi:hypothetical protein